MARLAGKEHPARIGEDARHVFLYKPPGMPVFPSHHDPTVPSLLSWWLGQGGQDVGWPEGFAGGIAHRLDNRSSGIIVVARTLARLQDLRAEFSGHTLHKYYLFNGPTLPTFETRILKTPIGHHPRKNDRMIAQQPGIKCRGKWYPTWTHLKMIAPGRYQAEIRTGVMHQIRVHAALAGIPLTDDGLYGGTPGPFLLCHYRISGATWGAELPSSHLP